MRPEPQFYVGRTRPSTVGWGRIGITLLMGGILAVLMYQRSSLLATLLVVAMLCGLALWTWMSQSTRFIVDERGLTVSLGGFLPRKPWPVEDFRTVQLRELPRTSAGTTLGGYGWRRGTVLTAQPQELTPVGTRKIFTLDPARAPYRVMATGPGIMVEIIGRSATNYIISPVDPQATAAAVDQAIRARR